MPPFFHHAVLLVVVACPSVPAALVKKGGLFSPETALGLPCLFCSNPSSSNLFDFVVFAD